MVQQWLADMIAKYEPFLHAVVSDPLVFAWILQFYVFCYVCFVFQPLDASGTTSSLQKVEPIIHSDAPILKEYVCVHHIMTILYIVFI